MFIFRNVVVFTVIYYYCYYYHYQLKEPDIRFMSGFYRTEQLICFYMPMPQDRIAQQTLQGISFLSPTTKLPLAIRKQMVQHKRPNAFICRCLRIALLNELYKAFHFCNQKTNGTTQKDQDKVRILLNKDIFNITHPPPIILRSIGICPIKNYAIWFQICHFHC